jgi:CHAD domain-containing protein
MLESQDAPLLSLPAPRAVRQIALRHLDRAHEAALRFRDREDPEALHDFRVGLRRLRATLRSYPEALGAAVPKKLRHRLRDLAASTAVARDTEVQLAWVDAQAGALRRHERAGHRWLHRHLRTRLLDEYGQLHDRLADDFFVLERKLRQRLQLPIDDAGAAMATLAANAVAIVLAEFASSLTGLGDSDDPHSIHPPRLIAKRLRYLLEPFSREAPAAVTATRALARLQDLLGDIHDRQVLRVAIQHATERAGAARFALLLELQLQAEVDPRQLAHARRSSELAGLVALSRTAQHEEEALRRRLREWIDSGAPDALVEQVQAARQALLPAAGAPVETGTADLPA